MQTASARAGVGMSVFLEFELVRGGQSWSEAAGRQAVDVSAFAARFTTGPNSPVGTDSCLTEAAGLQRGPTAKNSRIFRFEAPPGLDRPLRPAAARKGRKTRAAFITTKCSLSN